MKELYTAAGIFVVLILLGVWMVQNNRNEQEKKLVQLLSLIHISEPTRRS